MEYGAIPRPYQQIHFFYCYSSDLHFAHGIRKSQASKRVRPATAQEEWMIVRRQILNLTPAKEDGTLRPT
jgi:hypothetical protein